MKYEKTSHPRYKYILTEDYSVFLPEFSRVACEPSIYIAIDGGRISIKKGYAWDGPSGPSFDTENFMRGSLVHDALYQLIGEGRLDPVVAMRRRADDALHRICREDGMCVIRASWVYAAVRLFGGIY